MTGKWNFCRRCLRGILNSLPKAKRSFPLLQPHWTLLILWVFIYRQLVASLPFKHTRVGGVWGRVGTRVRWVGLGWLYLYWSLQSALKGQHRQTQSRLTKIVFGTGICPNSLTFSTGAWSIAWQPWRTSFKLRLSMRDSRL